VIATTNRPLEAAVAEGRFRADLYYRLNVIPLSLPPLRERGGDARELVEHFANVYAAAGNAARFSGELMDRMTKQEWPGNVRELANFVRRAVALSQGGEIGIEAFEHGKRVAVKEASAEEFPREISAGNGSRLGATAGTSPGATSPQLKPGLSLDEMERQLFALTLESTGGNRARAAELLGVSLRTVRNKVREFGLPPHNNYMRSGELQRVVIRKKEQLCP
jgi:DNA-binding NtrC family response regulator